MSCFDNQLDYELMHKLFLQQNLKLKYIHIGCKLFSQAITESF